MSSDGFRVWNNPTSNQDDVPILVRFQIDWSAGTGSQVLLTFTVEGETESYTVLNSNSPSYVLNFGYAPTYSTITGKVHLEPDDKSSKNRLVYEIEFINSTSPSWPYREAGVLAEWSMSSLLTAGAGRSGKN
ncbi:MAG TPA: hypothetical protein V6C86_21135 [Oculatellaceae cyanobacterium]